MKLLIRDNKIIGTATDSYVGDEITVMVDDDFDINDITKYRIENNELIILNDVEYLNAIKDQKLKLIQTKKNEMRDAGFLVDDVLFDSDMAARTAYLELTMQFQMDSYFTTKWKASNGVWMDMNYILYQQVMTAGKAHIESCFAYQEAKENEVKAAMAVDEVNAVII